MLKYIRRILLLVIIFAVGILLGILEKIIGNCTPPVPLMNKLEAQNLLKVMRDFQRIKQTWLTQIQGTEIWCIDVAMNDGSFKQIYHWSDYGY